MAQQTLVHRVRPRGGELTFLYAKRPARPLGVSLADRVAAVLTDPEVVCRVQRRLAQSAQAAPAADPKPWVRALRAESSEASTGSLETTPRQNGRNPLE